MTPSWIAPLARGHAVPGLPLRLSCSCGASVWFAPEGIMRASAWMEDHREHCKKKGAA